MDKIKFANGEIHDCTFCASTATDAFFAIDDVSFAQAAAIFSDTTKTARIECGDKAYIGYTTLVALAVQPYGSQAVLRGGHIQPLEIGGNNA